MTRLISLIAITFCLISFTSCEQKNPSLTDDNNDSSGVSTWPEYEIPEPQTIEFSNAEFSYNGDDIGEAISDGWIIKLYTDMEIDPSGNPIGPGFVIQLLLNARYDKDQGADASYLRGVYSEMLNSGNFEAGTFVPGYIDYIDIPGGRLEVADATFFAEVSEGSTQMQYDLIDEGALEIIENNDGTFTIAGILVGEKYTKRYFTWTGEVEVKNNVPERIPNSTIGSDLNDLSFVNGHLLDKGDCFYLKDQSYRCLLVFLTDENIEMKYGKPAGTGSFLRLELLVPWETDYQTDGVPAGTYTMVSRNEDTSMDKDKIVPGIGITGLPDRFNYPYISGSWYVEMKDDLWTDTYARIDGGSIEVVDNEDGSKTVSFNLNDCSKPAKTISGCISVEKFITH